jgi:hypothetical protein
MAIGVQVEDSSYRVVEAVARRKGVDPTELETRLNDVVDPDALDRLFSDGSGAREPPTGRVEFRYCGYDVTVSSDGRVTVSD